MPGYRFRMSVWMTCGVLYAGLLGGMCGGANWRVVQLTDNTVDDREPRVSAGRVVWTQVVGSDREILYYDGQRTVALTDNAVDDAAPDICVADPNVTVCWHASIGPGRTKEVFVYDGTKIMRLTDNAWDDQDAVCSDGHVVWRQRTDRADWEVFDYRPRQGIRRLTDDAFQDGDHAVSGPFTAWARITDTAREIWFHDGQAAHLVASGPAEAGEALSLDDGHLAWSQSADGYRQVWYYHPNDMVRRVTFDSHDNHGPALCGATIVWSGGTAEGEEIYLYAWNQTRRLTYNAVNDTGPQVAWPWVVYRRTTPDGSRSDIVVYDLGQGLESVIASPYAVNLGPRVDGGTVVWTAFDGQDYEIMLAVACDEMPGDANHDCVVDLQDLAALAGDWMRCTAPAEYCP